MLLLNQNKNLVYEFDEVKMIFIWTNKLHLTALHWAIKKTHYQSIKLLVAFESDLNATDILGLTPLHYAVISNDYSILKVYQSNDYILKFLLNLRAPNDFEYYDMYRLTKDEFTHSLMSISKMNEFIGRV